MPALSLATAVRTHDIAVGAKRKQLIAIGHAVGAGIIGFSVVFVPTGMLDQHTRAVVQTIKGSISIRVTVLFAAIAAHEIGVLWSKMDKAIAIQLALCIRKILFSAIRYPAIVFSQQARFFVKQIESISHLLHAIHSGSFGSHIIGNLRAKCDETVVIDFTMGIRKIILSFLLHPAILFVQYAGLRIQEIQLISYLH